MRRKVLNPNNRIKVTKITSAKQMQHIVSNPGMYTTDTVKYAFKWKNTDEGRKAIEQQKVARDAAKNKIINSGHQIYDSAKHGFQEAGVVVKDVFDSLEDGEMNEVKDYVKHGGGAKDSFNLLRGVGNFFSGVWDWFKA